MLSPLRPIFQSAYQHWFKGVEATSVLPAEAVLKRWWGVNVSKEDGAAFDQSCSDLFLKPLQDIAKLPYQQKEESQQSAQLLLTECAQDSPAEMYRDTLGLIILLDQMTRNIFRGDSASKVYSQYDSISQAVAYDALERGVDKIEHADQTTFRQWFYMPLMHSEDIKQHKTYSGFLDELEARNKGNADALKYLGMSRGAANKHSEIIEKFGRYPHRNACLKRESTPEEAKWLAEGGTYY
jgi:uncharacterized protein (DUF924 family)